MEYSKQFNYRGITIIFDKLEYSEQYPTFYSATRKGNLRPVAFIPKRKLICTGILTVSDTYKIASFTFDE